MLPKRFGEGGFFLEGYADVYGINYLFLRAIFHDFGHTTPSSSVAPGAPDTN